MRKPGNFGLRKGGSMIMPIGSGIDANTHRSDLIESSWCETSIQHVSIIALDADGVLLDYNAAYRHAWERAFGHLPDLRDRNAYWAIDRWKVNHLDGTELARFRACFDEQYWNSIPAIPNAVKACEELCAAGYELVCVSAIESQF